MTHGDAISKQIWQVISQLNEDRLLAPVGKYITYEIQSNNSAGSYPSAQNQLKILEKLQDIQAIRIIKMHLHTSTGRTILDSLDVGQHLNIQPKGVLLDILPGFTNAYGEYSGYGSYDPLPKEIESFKLDIKDRGIWVNEFLLSEPHATGKNMSLLEYLLERIGETIERANMPELLQKELQGRPFNKSLNDMGFKGELLKLFFPARGKSQIVLRSPVSLIEAEKSGVNIKALRLELQLIEAKRNKSR